MHFSMAIVGFLLMVSLCNAAIVQRRSYRNTQEILVPVTIIQDGEEIRQSPDLKENEAAVQIETEATAEDIATKVNEEQKLEAVEAVAEAQRRLDEAIVEEEIKEAIQEEQDKEIVKTIEEEKNLNNVLTEVPEIVAVLQPEVTPNGEQNAKLTLEVKVEEESPNRVVLVVESSNNEAEQPEGSVRQATQATPTQSTTQQNFVQQLIQNSPLGQFFNQITGQPTQSQVANDEAAPAAPAPTLPGLFNPVTAVQNAAQSVVNSTTQAFQGLQQFASNLGNQFQSTLSGLGGQQQEQAAGDVTTARPPGPIQQLVNSFIGNSPQAQPNPTQQGPLQGLLNIFQGNNRPQAAATTTSAQPQPQPQPPKETEPAIQEQTLAADADTNVDADADAAVNKPNLLSNEVRDSAEVNDSFEDTVQPDELIVVNDDVSQTNNAHEQEVVQARK